MTADQTPEIPQPAQAPARTLQDAVRELRGLHRQRANRKSAGRDTRFLAMLQQQSERRRAPDPSQPGGDDD